MRARHFLLMLVSLCIASGSRTMGAETQSSYAGECDTCLSEEVCDGCGDCPWSFTFTQTVDYGTNLALPLSLTPANTIVAPVTNVLNRNILDANMANALGIGDELLGGIATPNVGVVPIFEDDFQFQTTAGLTNRREVGENGTFTLGYTYYQSLHPQFDEIDLNSHVGTAQYAHRLTDRLVSTVDYSYSYYFLSDSTFVTQNRGGTGLLFRQNERWDWQIRGDYADANFRRARFLNSDNYSARAEAIRYLRGGRDDYLTFGYATGYSDAEFRGFSYQVNNVFVGGRWLFGADLRNIYTTTLSYGSYDFLGTDPIDVGVERRDDLFTYNSTVARQLSDAWTVFASYTYLDSDSNVLRQMYSSDLISLGVTFVR